MGQAKLKGATLADRRQRALDEGRAKKHRLSAAERDAAVLGAAMYMTAKVLNHVTGGSKRRVAVLGDGPQAQALLDSGAFELEQGDAP